MLKISAILLAVATLCSSYPAPYWSGFPFLGYRASYWNDIWRVPVYPHVPLYAAKLVFYGEFSGDCADKPDGLYYVDDRSFAYCFSGQKTIQPCAEGSANPPLDFFNQGASYGLADFCSVNLLAAN